MCADATDNNSILKLLDGKKHDMVFTDPPYGLGGYGGRNKMNLSGDDGTEEDIRFFYESIPHAKEMYVWGNYKNLMSSLWDTPRDVIIWVKNNFGLGAGYRGQYEMCFYWGEFSGSDTDVWHGDKDTEYSHPTQKPVALAARAMKNSSKVGDIILDIYLGSGSTLIAAEQLDRVCYGMDIDPHYVDIVRKRYARFIGQEDNWEEATPVCQS